MGRLLSEAFSPALSAMINAIKRRTPAQRSLANREKPNTNASSLDREDGATSQLSGVRRQHVQQSFQALRSTHFLVTDEDDDGRRARPALGEQLPEVGIARHDDSTLSQRVVQDSRVVLRTHTDFDHMLRVERCCARIRGEAMGKGLVEEEERYLCAARASCGFAGAFSMNRTASLTSSASRSGKSARISSVVIPPRTMAATVATGMRMPRIHGTPPICSGRMVIRGKPWTMTSTDHSSPHETAAAPCGCVPTPTTTFRVKTGKSQGTNPVTVESRSRGKTESVGHCLGSQVEESKHQLPESMIQVKGGGRAPLKPGRWRFRWQFDAGFPASASRGLRASRLGRSHLLRNQGHE